MRYDTQSGRHSKYSLQYHLVFCTKYRKKTLTEKVAQDLKEMIDDLAKEQDIQILNEEIDKDYIHILFRARPTTNLSKVINVLKGTTSRKLRKKYPQLKKHKAFWSPAYFLATTGEVTLNQLKKYVESQGK